MGEQRICQRCGKAYQGGGYRFCSEECRCGRGICKRCGREFQRAREGQKFCGECREASRPKGAACPYCGKEFASKYGQIFCSKECYESARAHEPEPCPVCGKGVPHGRRYCSDECKRRAHGTAHICQQCGREFFRVNKKNKAAKYCSPECSQKAQRTRADCTCLQCGKTFHPHGMAAGLYCSHQCAGLAIRTRDRICLICGKGVSRGANYYAPKYCSEGCREIAEERRKGESLGFEAIYWATVGWMRRLSESSVWDIRTCEGCGEVLRPPAVKWCPECRRKVENRAHDQRLYRNGKPDLSITLWGVYRRDKGVCRGCGRFLEFGENPNADGYPSIDHIIPIAKGGLHRWDNVQLMCRKCNWLKSDSEGWPSASDAMSGTTVCEPAAEGARSDRQTALDEWLGTARA